MLELIINPLLTLLLLIIKTRINYENKRNQVLIMEFKNSGPNYKLKDNMYYL